MKPFVLFYILIILCASNFTNSGKEKLNVRCVPFRTTTSVPLTDRLFDSDISTIKLVGKEVGVTDQIAIDQVRSILDKICKQRPISLDDYDVRASLNFSRAKRVYYINWDRKSIMFKKNFYPITENDFVKISKLVSLCDQ